MHTRIPASTQNFRKCIIQFVKSVPKGRVVSYGQVAAACGHPRAARQVGGVLRSINHEDGAVPWWRVINNQGYISIRGNWVATKDMQAQALRSERVEVDESYRVDMEKYRYKN